MVRVVVFMCDRPFEMWLNMIRDMIGMVASGANVNTET